MKKALRAVVGGFLLFNLGGAVVMEQFKRFAMSAYATASSSMEPTLHCPRPVLGCEGETKDRFLVLRFAPFWTPRRGDLIVYRAPRQAIARCGARGTFVHRLIGLPGETVTDDNGVIFVDGRRLSDSYVKRSSHDSVSRKWTVPEGQYFVMGDNRGAACDSRVWGTVPRDHFVGPVVARYWPFDRFGLL